MLGFRITTSRMISRGYLDATSISWQAKEHDDGIVHICPHDFALRESAGELVAGAGAIKCSETPLEGRLDLHVSSMSNGVTRSLVSGSACFLEVALLCEAVRDVRISLCNPAAQKWSGSRALEGRQVSLPRCNHGKGILHHMHKHSDLLDSGSKPAVWSNHLETSSGVQRR
jgi:hypothetical protein